MFTIVGADNCAASIMIDCQAFFAAGWHGGDDDGDEGDAWMANQLALHLEKVWLNGRCVALVVE